MTSADLSELRRALMDAEGFRASAYQDSEGFWTIGFGRLIDERKGGRISREEGLLLLENDISTALHECERAFPWFTTLDPVRQRVLVELRFNLGLAGLQAFKQTLAAFERHDFDAAAHGLRQSKWYGQVKRRGVRLVAMTRTGADPT
jgi:lysozyme